MRFVACRASRRLRSSILFVPESERFVFDSEKLSDAENRAAIPSRPPPPADARTQYYDILPPTAVADAVVRPDFGDILATSLAHMRAFGDPALKMVPRSGAHARVQHLHFEARAHKWITEFGKLVYPLKPLEALEAPAASALPRRIESHIAARLEEDALAVLAADDFDAIFGAFDVFRNHQRRHLLHQSELANVVSFDQLALFLLDRHLGGDVAALVALLTFIERNLALCLYEDGVRPMTELAIARLSRQAHDLLVLDTFDRFYDEAAKLFPKIASDLLLALMDQLARLSFELTNARRGLRIAKAMVRRHSTAPSRETYDALVQWVLWEAAAAETRLQRRAAILRYLSDFKPLVFHWGATEASVGLLLDTVSTSFELDHLVRFVERTPQLLQRVHPQLLQCLASVQPAAAATVRDELEAAQLVRRLRDNGVEMGSEADAVLARWPSLQHRQ
jgi:hypothetical protein